jgi:hypothetical protein
MTKLSVLLLLGVLIGVLFCVVGAQQKKTSGSSGGSSQQEEPRFLALPDAKKCSRRPKGILLYTVWALLCKMLIN